MKNIKNWNEFNKLNEKFFGSVKMTDGDISFYENPENLKNKNPEIRGIITKNGNFYIFEYPESFAIHQHGLDAAFKLKIISKKYPYKIWINSPPTEFVCMQRHPGTSEFYVSESYLENIYEKYYETFRKFIDNAQKKAEGYNNTLLFFTSTKPDEHDKAEGEVNKSELSAFLGDY